MLSVSAAVQNTISQALAVSGVPRVLVEWNHNRYTGVTTVDNWGSSTEAINAFDPDVFPISEIVNPLRPTAGILVGKTGEGVSTSGTSDSPPAYRTYTSSPDNKYKYWTSQVSSGSSANGGGGFTIDSTKASPYVVYSSLVQTNKIYLCFETSWAKPVVYTIKTTVDGTTWVTAASNVVPNADGTVALYRQADNSWGATAYYANPTQLKGIQVVCSSVSKVNSFLNVIEMGLRLQDDLSNYALSYSLDMEMSDDSVVAPIGTISANTGQVEFSNVDGRFNTDAPAVDTTPLYRGLIDANAKVTIDVAIDSSGFGGTRYEYVRQAVMYTDTWAGDQETSTATLKDASKYLQEVKPNRIMMTDVTPGMAIWRILDSVGYNNYSYTRGTAENANKIPFYWTDSEKTAWELIQEICEATQTAVYCDANGVLQIRTAQKAYDFTQVGTPDWVFDYALNGSKQPDIETLNVGDQFEVNHVTVHYRPTDLAKDSQNRAIQETVWQPDTDTVVLRSSSLRADMDSTQMFFYISQTDATYWPYSGMVNIRGELIRYEGKQYRYRNSGGAWTMAVLKSSDDKLHIDNDLSSATLGYQNYFTGKMIIVERGYDWTTAAAHDTTIASWKAAGPAHGGIGGAQTTWTGGLRHIPDESILRMSGRATWDTNHFYEAPHSPVFAQVPNNIGTRFRFPSKGAGSVQQGGIFIHSNSAMNTMYLIDIISTDYCDQNTHRNYRDEILIMKRTGGVTTTLVGRGRAHLIAQDVWNDVDVTVSGGTISVFINGHNTLTVTDNSLTPTAKLGLYTRGYTVMDFEYFYYASGANWPDPDTDNSSYLDLIRGGYYSDQHYKDGFYRTREARRKHGKRTITYKQRYAQRFFDEFGILVHEVRPFSVTFDKGPCVFTDLYFSNISQAVCLDYVGDPFGANFTLANASRDNAVIQGADDITFGVDNVVNQVLFVSGRTVQQQDEKTVEAKNDAAIRARGDIPLDVTSDWIQTEGHATDLSNWITNNWSTPADTVELESFGNPILEIGDIVAVNFPPRNMTAATHQYFVIKITHDFSEGGLSSVFTLRRARNPIY
jgi:hypothetical protein